MTNLQIAAVFEQIADLLEFQGANAFRVRAYRNAARTIADAGEPVADRIGDPRHKLTDIQGIGADLAEKIATLVNTGSLPILEELRAEIPETVLAMLRVPGLGPKRASALYRELGVKGLEDLRAACESRKVRALKGFGAKTEEAILKNIDLAAQADERLLWVYADDFAQALVAHLREGGAVRRIEVAGSYRRGKETVGDLDLLVVADDVGATMDRFAAFPEVREVLLRGDTKMSVRLGNRFQVDLRIVPEESFGAALQYFTGSQAHNIALRSRARDRGLKINEYGVFRGEQSVAGRTEEEVYAQLDLPWIPPELREARREFEWADAGQLPKLVEVSDLRGDLHAHTTWTDGLSTLEEMVEAARRRGLKYLAITDHSQRVAMAGGLTPQRIRAQWAEIDRLNARLEDFTVLKGVEVDILERLEEGLDLPDDVLAEADWVVASVHYGQNQPGEQITARVLAALENPYVSAIGHPTGRLINKRRPYEIDLEAVFETARRHGKTLELNAHPSRLDLDDVACAAAKRHGVPVVISTDAHHTDGLAALRYGVLQARRGGLTADDVANTRPWSKLKRMLRHS